MVTHQNPYQIKMLLMLPVFYQTYLETQFSTREYLFLKIIITVLQSIQNIALESLAAQLPMPILFESRRKKIQRFLSLPNLTIEKVWLPIVKAWLEETFTAKSVVYLIFNGIEPRSLLKRKWKLKKLIIYSFQVLSISRFFQTLRRLQADIF